MTKKPPHIPPPQNHQWLETEDGSWTIFSEHYQEAAHSTHGAIAETKLRFIQGCKLFERQHEGRLDYKIFEVGFGLGMGLLESFSLWLKHYQHLKVEFISSEIDKNLILWCKDHLPQVLAEYYSDDVLKIIQDLQLDPSGLFYQSNYNNAFYLKIFIGDILHHQDYLLRHYSSTIDSIFQDAYSPKKNPSLWTIEWFKFLKKLCHSSSILSTYSSSSSVRQNMLAAEFFVTNGPGFGKKKSSSIAFTQLPQENTNEKK